MTIFEATPESLDIFKRARDKTNPNYLQCKHCKTNWSNHAPKPQGKIPAGMCLTEANLQEVGAYIIS